ncbi:MAG: TonB-dependent receptor [Pseudomonadales bacterium]|jgi:iron complex outermembrane receptor protein|nr:TonB-dependent receptor [Pseudomonadales bacterium]
MQIFRTPPFALGLLAVALTPAYAQTNSGEIEELITTAIHVRSSETALPVTVLSGDELHEAASATLGETLGSQPGLNNASFGPAVGQTVVRGQQGRRVMNLSNGMPIADASGNSADHAQTVEAILATTLEVLRGPSTLLYGGGAIGGVVNVGDRRIASSIPSAPALALESRYDGASDLSTTVGSLEFSHGNLVWHFDGLYRQWNDLKIPGFASDPRYLDGDTHSETNSEGFIANTGGRGNSASGAVSWVFDQGGHLGLAYNKQENFYGLPPGAHGHEESEDADQEEAAEAEEFVHIDMQRERYDLDGEWLDLAPWAERLSYKLSYTDYAHSEIEGDGATGTRFSNESWQQRLQITHTDSPERHGALGLQRADEVFAAVGEESFIPVTDIASTGLFLVEDFHLTNLTFEGGGRINRDQYTPQSSPAPARGFTTYSLSGSALWDMNAATTLGLSLSRSQRAPSVEELYSNYDLNDLETCVIHHASGSCEIGDSGFGAETSFNTDLTLSFNYERFDATLTAFYNRFNDYIGQVATGEEAEGFPVLAYAQDDARFTGLEVSADWQLGLAYKLSLFGDLVRGHLDNLGDAPRMPAARIGTELRYDGANWSLFASAQHAFAQDRAGQFELGTAAWTRVDLGADYTLNVGAGELLLFARAHNLTNEDIRLATSYLRGFAPEAGRALEAGVRYSF